MAGVPCGCVGQVTAEPRLRIAGLRGGTFHQIGRAGLEAPAPILLPLTVGRRLPSGSEIAALRGVIGHTGQLVAAPYPCRRGDGQCTQAVMAQLPPSQCMSKGST